jgi:hypothetical protein
MLGGERKALNHLHHPAFGKTLGEGEVEARQASPPHCPEEGNQEQEDQKRCDRLTESFQVALLRPTRLRAGSGHEETWFVFALKALRFFCEVTE